MEVQEYDVVVVGCGISGISAAYHLSKNCPWAKFIVLERRSDLGGTWSLFKYPGIRSDSDMFTFGFGWRPWTNNKIISPKEQILEYLNGAVDDENLRQYIKFDHNVLSASFSSQEQTWTLQVENGVTIRSSYVMFNTGYYQYENPYTPEFPGKENFSGLVVHPQLWPSDLDYSNKKVVVIGSGATAATLVPAMAEAGAAKVTMLQRSPSYFVSRDNDGDWFYSFWSTLFGDSVAHRMNRLRYIIYGQLMFESAQALPSLARAAVIKQMRDQCPQDFDVDTHFSPKYGVWDQRVCLIPDGDFFLALHDGKVDIVTDNIDEFVETGIRTESGNIIEADIIVSATGLNLQENLPMSTIKVDVDGKPYNAPDHFIYRGCMLSGVPNFVFTLGYSNGKSFLFSLSIMTDTI